MIIGISVTNFRSIRDSFGFTLEAESGAAKPDNFFELDLVNENKLKLLKSAVIYGPNASGKTNFIRAVFNLTEFIKKSSDFRVESPIDFYEPFLFDPATENAPSKMAVDFLLPGDNKLFTRYHYEIEFNRDHIILEELYFYPLGQAQNLFKRHAPEPKKGSEDPVIIHTARLSKNLGYKEYDVFHNQLLLSKFGKDIPHQLLSTVYLYFNNVEVWNALDINKIDRLKKEIADELMQPENQHLQKRINQLLRIADTKIDSININQTDIDTSKLNVGAATNRRPPSRDRDRVSAVHTVYHNGKETGFHSLPLRQESAGTNVLFALGGIILKRLEKGGVLFFDELDNSLHPRLSKFLVRLFNNTVSNPHNSQLVVATHEVTLLDKDIFRKDQIWFSEKDKYGVTSLFSAKEFEGVRDETPFDKWYMNGKFGGQPNIKEIEFIFGNE